MYFFWKEMFKNVLTRINHGLLNGLGIFSRPFLHFFVHFGDLLRVHSPQASFPLVCSVCRGLFNLLKTFVERQVVSHRVLPAVGSGLEVRKVFTENMELCKKSCWNIIYYKYLEFLRPGRRPRRSLPRAV